MAKEHKRPVISRRDLLVGAMSVGAAAALPKRARAAEGVKAGQPARGIHRQRMVSRASHSTSLLEPGWALLAGGFIARRATRSAVLINTATGELRSVRPMRNARARHASLTLADGRMLVLGGFNGRFLASVEAYDPMTNTWSRLPGLSVPRADFTAVEVPGGLLIMGGTGQMGPMRNETYPLEG